MARPRALSNAQVFELADSLLTAGIEPTVARLAEKAREQFEVSPSFSTLKGSLQDWRRLGGAGRPKGISPQFLQTVLDAFGPLYDQLSEQIRAEHEPQLTTARQAADVANDALMQSDVERRRQESEIFYLRGLVEKSSDKEREYVKQLAELVHVRADAEKASALLESTQAQTVSLARDLDEARDAQKRELQFAKERIKTLESQLADLLARRSELDQRYESIIDHLQKQDDRRQGTKP
jgi:Plasmid replication region DNA-binding N-term